MKKILLSAVLATAMVMSVKAAEYKHISPVTIQPIQFNMDQMREANGDNLDVYLTNLASLQSDLERQGKEVAAAQKNLSSEKKLYDAQMKFLKNRQSMVKNSKKFYEGEVKNYEGELKNVKKQYEMIQKMPDVSSVAVQEQLQFLRELEQDCNDRKAQATEMLQKIANEDEKGLDKAYEVLSQYLIEINDKATRLENLAAQTKNDIGMVKNQIKSIKDQIKAAAKK